MDTYAPTPTLTPVDFDPFAGLEILLLAPTTEPQIEIWLSCVFGGDEASCAYNESFSLLLKGVTNVEALKKAVEALVKRHEALRSVFSPDGSKMIIYDYLAPELDFKDISGESFKHRQKVIDSYNNTNMRTPFNIVDGPLMRVKIFKLAEGLHQLTLTLHHIVCDGWSFGVVMQELSIYYSAFVKGIIPNLPEAPKYSKYAIEQLTFPKTEKYQEIEQYWLKTLKGTVPAVDLPVDHNRPQRRLYNSRHYKHTLNTLLSTGIKKLAAKANTSLITTLLAAFEIWLQNTTGQRETVVGMPAAGQTATGQLGLVGHCVNLLPLKSVAYPEFTFMQYLKQRHSGLLDAYDHQLITYGTLLKKLNVRRDPSRLPLVSVVFNSDMGMDEGIIFEGLTHELDTPPRKFENFELFVNVNNIGSGLHLDWSYNAGLFTEESIIAMMDGFEDLLIRITAEPNVLIGDLAGKTRADKNEITEHLNKTAAAYLKDKPAHKPTMKALLTYYKNFWKKPRK